jgi:hypothetical protein
MKNTLLVLSLLITVNSYCQKQLVVTDNKPSHIFHKDLNEKLSHLNLEDLRVSEDKKIRIWRQNEILTFGDSVEITYYVSQGEKTISETYTLQKNFNLDSLQARISGLNFFKNKEERSKIDEYPLTIEINTSEAYHQFSGYGSKELNEIVLDSYEQFSSKSLRNRFVNHLPRGNYRIGMGVISVDHLIGDAEEKTDFYKKVIQDAESELQISQETLATEFPMIYINEKPANFKSINLLNTSTIESYRILPETPTIRAIYGEKGRNGVILINTK